MAKRRRGRPLDGVLVLDKPAGMTSNAALQTCKRLYNAAKAGHTGSLDPLATGVLPLCFGEATKFTRYLLDADKAYDATFVLGVSTNTGDAEGAELVRISAAAIGLDDVEDMVGTLRGDIEQMPPMFSALKVNGQPLYKLARQGREVERQSRQVSISRLDVNAFRGGEVAEVDVSIACSKGTYVRSLAESLGAALGVGGHVKVLRRTFSGCFGLDGSHPLERLQSLGDDEAFADMDALLLPVSSLLGNMPILHLDADSAHYILRGQAVFVPKSPANGEVCLHDDTGRFIGLGWVQKDGKIAPKRTIANN